MQNNLNELFEIIDQRVKIEEIISNYISLEKKGNNFIGLCPFHDDKTPSLHVSSAKKIYKCFSCGAGGNSIKFIQNYEQINFIEALKKLCQYLNIDWKDYLFEKEIIENKQLATIKKINLETKNYFKYLLFQGLEKENGNIFNYLKKRKLIKKNIGRFELGWAEKGNNLSNFLLKKGYTEEEILTAKLAINHNGKLIDFFQNRLIFPILNEQNEVIAFSGRSIEKNSNLPKYINSSNTDLFHKEKTLYNLNFAKLATKKANCIIIVEGFMDVIAYHNANFDNVVAIMGTNFSNYHYRKLYELTDNFIFSFDNDSPGKKLLIKIAIPLLKKPLNLYVTNFEKGKDFDEFYQQNPEQAKLIIKNKISFLDYLIEKIMPKKTLKEKEINFILTLISYERDGIKREILLNKALSLSKFEFAKKLINDNYEKILLKTNFLKIKRDNDLFSDKIDINVNIINKINAKIEWEETILLFLLIKNRIFNTEKYHFINKKLRDFYQKISNPDQYPEFNLKNKNELNIKEEEILRSFNKIEKWLITKQNQEQESQEINDRILKINYLNRLLAKEKIRYDFAKTQDKTTLDWLLKKSLNN